MFKPGIIYPQDHIGRYIDLEGLVVEVCIVDGDDISISIQTNEGIFTGYTRWSGDKHKLSNIAGRATIRHYDWGGGFYPEDRVIGWSYNYEAPATQPLPLPG